MKLPIELLVMLIRKQKIRKKLKRLKLSDPNLLSKNGKKTKEKMESLKARNTKTQSKTSVVLEYVGKFRSSEILGFMGVLIILSVLI